LSEVATVSELTSQEKQMIETTTAAEIPEDGHLEISDHVAQKSAGAQLTTPAKFLDPETGNLRVDALMKSYTELEKRMGAGNHLDHADTQPADDTEREDDLDITPVDLMYDDIDSATLDAEFDEEDGSEYSDISRDGDVPLHPDNYQITTDHPWLEPDQELNSILHEHSFSQDQAQVVYDLAHEHVLPLFEQLAGQIAELRGENLLRETFAGDDWQSQATQVKQWGEAALPPDLYDTLATTQAGVSAMHQLMQHGEPRFLDATTSTASVEKSALRRMMDDPRYWRDHDPDLVSRVQDGFANLYPD